MLNVCTVYLNSVLYFYFYLFICSASSPSPSEKENSTILAHMHMSLRNHVVPDMSGLRPPGMAAGQEAKAAIFPDSRSQFPPPAMQYMGMGHFQNWQLAAH
jgi:hypothetical protein